MCTLSSFSWRRANASGQEETRIGVSVVGFCIINCELVVGVSCLGGWLDGESLEVVRHGQ